MVLSETFGFHDIAIRDCLERNHMSKLHVYDDHVFTVLHAPEIGTAGHVHYVELDQFLGPNYLVTVHGPLNPAVDPEVAFLDTAPSCGGSRTAAYTPDAVRVVLGDRVGTDPPGDRHDRDPGQTVRGPGTTTHARPRTERPRAVPGGAVQGLVRASRDPHHRRARRRHLRPDGPSWSGSCRRRDAPASADIADRFHQVASMADGQREFLHGVIEFFQTRTSTHMTIAAEALSGTSVQQNDDMRRITAWVAIVAVPTAVTGFFGQNVPYPGSARTPGSSPPW